MQSPLLEWNLHLRRLYVRKGEEVALVVTSVYRETSPSLCGPGPARFWIAKKNRNQTQWQAGSGPYGIDTTVTVCYYYRRASTTLELNTDGLIHSKHRERRYWQFQW